MLVTLSAPVAAQTAEQRAVGDVFLTALMNRDWTGFYNVASDMLKSQSDSTQYAGILDQIEGSFGAYQSRWLASATLAKQYAVFVWHARFTNDSLAIQVVIDEKNMASGLWFRPIEDPYTFPPPPYAKADTFEEDRKIFGSETKLPGTLVVPKGKGPFPVVVLVAGSGPNDRDETIKGNKPFRDIAWGLAMHDIASFRYDKRTKVYPDDFDDKTMSVEEEVIIDALEAVKFVASQDNIDKTNIFLLGHSLGGMLGPEIALRNGSLDGLILLAAPARDLVSVTIGQLEFFRQSATSPAEQTHLEEQIAVGKNILKGTATMRDTFLGASANYYYKLNTYNQIETARKLAIPMYIAQAGKDYQVPMVEFEMWQQALEDKKDVAMKVYPDAFHLFINTEEAPGRSNYEMQGHVTKELVDDLARWIQAQ